MILAVDIGTASCGWAVVRPRTGRVLDLGVIMQPRNPELGVHEDRRRRIREQAAVLSRVANEHDCSAIAAEEMSFGGPPRARLSMGVSQALCWGSLSTIAELLELQELAIPPKTWQRAIVPESGKKVDYDVVFARLVAFVGDLAALHTIAESHRNHALDAVGIGVYTALRHDVTCAQGST